MLACLHRLLVLQELHLLEQFVAAHVGHQSAVECMQEATQGRRLQALPTTCCMSGI